MLCPVRDQNWNKLINTLSRGTSNSERNTAEVEAYRIFKAHGEKTPPVPIISQFKDEIGMKDGKLSDEEKSTIISNIDNYNNQYGTSHSVVFSEYHAKLVLNFMPKAFTDMAEEHELTVIKDTRLLAIKTISSPERVNNIISDPYVKNLLDIEEDTKHLMTLRRISDRILSKSNIYKKSADDQKALISKVLDDAVKMNFGIVFGLQSKLETEDMIANQYAQAITGFYLEIMKNELPIYLNKINTDSISSAELNSMLDALELYSSVISEIEGFVISEGDSLSKKITSGIIDTHSKFSSSISTLKAYADKMLREKMENLVHEALVDVESYDVNEILSDTMQDINQMHRWFGSIRNAPDDLMKIVFRNVVFQKNKNYQRMINYKNELLEAQLKIEKAGYKDLSIIHDKYNGKKTGYLISEYKWGEYYTARSEMYEKIRERLRLDELPSYDDLSKEQKEIWNEEFKKFADMYMVESHGSYVPDLRKLKNNDFTELMKDKNFSEYYNLIKKSLDESKDMLPKSYKEIDGFEYMLPQIRKTNIETLMSGAKWSGIKERIKEGVVRTSQDTEFGSHDVILDYNNNPVKLVPVHYTSLSENPDDLSSDITSMTLLYRDMALNFSTMSQQLEDIKVIQQHMSKRHFKKGSRAGSGAASKSMELLETFLDSEIYGIANEMIIGKIGNKEVNWTKVIDRVIDFIRANNLFLNPFTIISGTTKASIDFLLDKFAEKHTSFESARWAELELDKNLVSLMDNVLKRKKTGKMSLMFEYNGLYGGLEEQFKNLNIENRAMRVTGSKLLYATYELADIRIRGKLALSVYDNFRFVNGEFITKSEFIRLYKDSDKKWSDYKDKTLYGSYENKDGAFKVKDEWKEHVSSNLEARVKSIIDYRVATITGQLTSHDKTHMGRSIIGKFLMLHRNWMVSGITERFKKQNKDFTTGELDEGYYRTFGKWIKLMATESGSIRQKLSVWNTLDHYQKGNVKKMIGDLSFFALAIAAAGLLNAAADDEPDSYWMQFLAMTVNRIRLEQGAFFNPNEVMSLLNSPTAGAQLIESAVGVFRLATDWEKIKYGTYEDMYRWEKAILQNSLLKNVWSVRNADAIEQKRKYLLSQILN